MRQFPDMVYAAHPTDGRTIIVKAYETGFYECGPGYREQNPMVLNKHYGFTDDPETVEVMLMASMFGWEIPAVKKWRMGEASFNARPVNRPVQKRRTAVKRTSVRRR